MSLFGRTLPLLAKKLLQTDQQSPFPISTFVFVGKTEAYLVVVQFNQEHYLQDLLNSIVDCLSVA